MQAPRGFGSDNHATVHPQIMAAIHEANRDHAPSYGTDLWTQKANEVFKKHFGSKTQVFYVFNGSAANMLALRALTLPGQAVLCSDMAHIHLDEAGGPEFFIQGKIRTLPSTHGKISVADLAGARIRSGDTHYAQNRVLSLTQTTELGTVYSIAELKELITEAKSQGLFVHIDGARLGVAARYLGVEFADFTTELGVDVVSFGGTKNGLMGGEAVLFLNPSLANHFAALRKQSGQLPSKTRFIAAQFLAYFENDLWKDIADRSLMSAKALAEGVGNIPGVEITRPRQGNVVFAKIPKKWVKPLREKHFFYIWDERTWECRWMTSWDLEGQDVQTFVTAIKEVSR